MNNINSTNKSLAIYCAGGLGKEVYDLAVRNYSDTYSEFFFVDDDESRQGIFYGAKVKKFTSLKKCDNLEFVIATGEPFIKTILREKIEKAGFNLATLIDTTALVAPSAKLGSGVIVSYGTVVSSDAVLGDGVFLQPNCVIGHDASLGADCVVSSFCQVSGNCTVGNNVYLGVGSSIKERINIGNGTIVGMGSFVYRDVAPLSIAVGNPARVVGENTDKRVFK